MQIDEAEPFMEDSVYSRHINRHIELRPSWDKRIEVYSEESGDKTLDADFAQSVKIKSLQHLGTGGQAEVYKC